MIFFADSQDYTTITRRDAVPITLALVPSLALAADHWALLGLAAAVQAVDGVFALAAFALVLITRTRCAACGGTTPVERTGFLAASALIQAITLLGEGPVVTGLHALAAQTSLLVTIGPYYATYLHGTSCPSCAAAQRTHP